MHDLDSLELEGTTHRMNKKTEEVFKSTIIRNGIQSDEFNHGSVSTAACTLGSHTPSVPLTHCCINEWLQGIRLQQSGLRWSRAEGQTVFNLDLT